jgi:murein DD-endopeptidase MepM/ murein hydrolase activator NlpD
MIDLKKIYLILGWSVAKGKKLFALDCYARFFPSSAGEGEGKGGDAEKKSRCDLARSRAPKPIPYHTTFYRPAERTVNAAFTCPGLIAKFEAFIGSAEGHMPTLLQRYKSAERIVYKKATAVLVRFMGRIVSAWKRFLYGGRQSLSILVVAHNEEPPRGIRISLFSLAGAILALGAIVIFVFAFSGSLGGARAKVSASNAELSKAREELDALKAETARLSQAYDEFQAALEPILAAGGSRDSAKTSKKTGLPLFGKRETEAKSIADIRGKLDLSGPVIADYGSMLGRLNSVKRTVPAIWPINGDIGHISTLFGTTANPFTGQSYFHTGIDCSTYRSGDLVIATSEGKVVFAGVQGGYGRCIIIAHAYGYMTRYGHMDRLLVHSGQTVKQGQGIGILGNTGVSTAPHVHYEVIMGKRYLDPTDYLWEGARSHPILTGGGSSE